MYAAIVGGVCLFVLFTVSTADICSDVTDQNSEVYQCTVKLASLACEGDCKSILEEYADNCLGDGAQAYKDTIETVCSTSKPTNPASDSSSKPSEIADSAGGIQLTLSSLVSAVFFAVYTAFV